MKTKSPGEILEQFSRVYLPIGGYPDLIICNTETSNNDNVFHEHLTQMGTTFTKSLPFGPQSAGQIEAQVGKIKRAITQFVRKEGARSNWDQYLHRMSYILNNVAVGNETLTPFEKLFGFKKSVKGKELEGAKEIIGSDVGHVMKNNTKQVNKDKQVKSKESQIPRKNPQDDNSLTNEQVAITYYLNLNTI